MSAYCAEIDVEGLTGKLYGSSSKPTTTNITSWISSISNKADVALYSAGISTPVIVGTSPVSYDVLKYLVAIKVAAMAEKSVLVGQTENAMPKRVIDWEKEWDDSLRDITGFNEDGEYVGRKMILPDVTKRSGSAFVPSSPSVEDGEDKTWEFIRGEEH